MSSSPHPNGMQYTSPMIIKMEVLKEHGENLMGLKHMMSLATPSPHGSEHQKSFDEETANIDLVQDPENPFTRHTFYGPPDKNSNDRVLHTTRQLDATLTPIRFTSESHAIDLPEAALIDPALDYGDLIEATFPQDRLGFSIEISYPVTSDVVHVTVIQIDVASPAAQAGVLVGDLVLVVNDMPIEANMSESDILDLIQTAESPRQIIFLHVVETKASKALFGLFGGQVGTVSPSKLAKSNSMRSLGSEIGQATRESITTLADSNVAKKSKAFLKRSTLAIGSRLRQLPAAAEIQQSVSTLGSRFSTLGHSSKDLRVHLDSFCDGCAMTPVIGALWSCSVCDEFSLCQDCYSRGIHGHEGTETSDRLNIILASEKLKKRCSKFTPEFLDCLCHDICKVRLDKYEYLGNWLAEIVGGTQAAKIVVRGIEIPQLSQEHRAKFIGLLMPIATNRTDIEVHIEWLEDTTALDEESQEMLQKVRIWISDKKNRTKSPFT